METKLFFDVNVLLDFFLQRKSNSEDFNQLYTLIDDGKIEAFITLSTLQTCIYFLEQAKGRDVTIKILEVILDNFNFLEGGRKHVIQAMQSNQNDLEDAIHYFICLDHELDGIITSDKNFLKLNSTVLPILTPSQFLKKLS